MTKSAKQILIEARELIAPEERWTQNSFARSAKNRKVNEFKASACKWCAVGAIRKVSFEESPNNSPELFFPYRAARDLLDKVGSDWGYPDIMDFNDDNRHAEVLAAFDRAIAIA